MPNSFFTCGMTQIRLWQWLNVLALDAVIIALLWQSLFSKILGHRISIAAQSVLGISVWLVYTADRLFDVMPRAFEQLHSVRHRFVKQNLRILWIFWISLLIADIAIAFGWLGDWQFKNGLQLLVICLLYIGLSQKFSARFFPKEFFVALIFAGGVIIFLIPVSGVWLPSGVLFLLCLINCLIIGIKERSIDAALQIRSMAQLNSRLAIFLYFSCLFLSYFLGRAWLLPLGLTLAILLVLHIFMQRFPTEHFRVLVDSALMISPLLALLC